MRRKKSSKKEIIILSGLSGAGKTSALHVLEDFGYFTVDNCPGELFPNLAKLLMKPRVSKEYHRLALVMDARGINFLKNFKRYLKALQQTKIKIRILFLEAREDVLIRRFSQTRRKHPLASSSLVRTSIDQERKLLLPIRALTSQSIDTSSLSVHELRERIIGFLNKHKASKRLLVNFLSFGYRFGVPLESDLVIDVRFIPNPYFVNSLQGLSGKHKSVQKYILRQKETKRFIPLLKPMIRFLLKNYEREGKAYLTIAFGCTGGRHRSVMMAQQFGADLKRWGYATNIYHRDIEKGDV